MAAVLETKPIAIAAPAADATFEPYGRLLRMLMPSLRGIVVHDGFANLVWASDEWDLADEPRGHQGRDRECACPILPSLPASSKLSMRTGPCTRSRCAASTSSCSASSA